MDLALLLGAVVALGVGLWLPPLLATAAVVCAAAALTAANQALDPGVGVVNDLVFFLVVLGAPAVAGSTWTSTSRRAHELARLSELRRRQVAAEVEAARTDELGRLARTVQHEMIQAVGAITLQAQGALRSDVATARTAMAPIERSAREALDLLRGHVGLLRRSEPGGDVPPDPLAGAGRPDPPRLAQPRPRLSRLDGLAALAAMPTAVEVVVHSPVRGPWWANVLLALTMAAPLLVRRRRPVLAAAVAVALMVAAASLLTPPTVLVTPLLTLLLLAHAVGAYGRGGTARPAGLVVLLGGGLVVAAAAPGPADLGALAGASVLVTVALLAGVVTAHRTQQVERLRQLVEEIETGARAEVRLARARQRLEVARDLHDSVAAAMTVICLHATVVARLPHAPAEQVRASLETVATTAREAAGELRAGLDRLEEPGPPSVTEVVRQARAAGLAVHLDRPPGPLPQGTEQVLARAVRESLVNVARHAPGAEVTVRVTVQVRDGAEVAEVDVVDHGRAIDATGAGPARVGPGITSPGTGTGLVGLAERFAAAGGHLEYGPLSPDGFRVHGLLPHAGAAR